MGAYEDAGQEARLRRANQADIDSLTRRIELENPEHVIAALRDVLGRRLVSSSRRIAVANHLDRIAAHLEHSRDDVPDPPAVDP